MLNFALKNVYFHGSAESQIARLCCPYTHKKGIRYYIHNYILFLCCATGVLNTASGVLKDQAEADEDMSLKQRLVLAGGSTLSGASEMVDNEVIAGAMEVGGESFTEKVARELVIIFLSLSLSLPPSLARSLPPSLSLSLSLSLSIPPIYILQVEF